MSKIPTKRVPARRKPAAARRRPHFPLRRRSSYLEPSAETLASMNEDTSQHTVYRTAEEFFRALDEDTSD
jgi:hypothetical protein